MEAGAQFTKDQGPLMAMQVMHMRSVPYAEAIGCVLWPVMITWLDCMFMIGILSQFIQNLGTAPLGSPKKGPGLFGIDKGPVAYLWRMRQNSS